MYKFTNLRASSDVKVKQIESNLVQQGVIIAEAEPAAHNYTLITLHVFPP